MLNTYSSIATFFIMAKICTPSFLFLAPRDTFVLTTLNTNGIQFIYSAYYVRKEVDAHIRKSIARIHITLNY